MDLVESLLGRVLDLVVHPASAFWAPGLLLSLLAAVAWYGLAERVPLRALVRRVLPRDPRYRRELPADLGLTLFNHALSFLLQPVFGTLIAVQIAGTVTVLAGGASTPEPLSPGPLAAVAFVAWIAGDYALYWAHRIFHEVPALWRLHAVHHRPEVLTPFTAYRFHPLDHVASLLANSLAVGGALAVCALLTGHPAVGLQVFGINVFHWTWRTLLSPLRHSHVPLPYPRLLSYVLVSPVMHQVHHSSDPRHVDRNYGTALSVWDWLHGTLVIPDPERPLAFGLTRTEAGEDPLDAGEGSLREA